MKKVKLKKLNADLFKKSTIKTEQKVNIKGGCNFSDTTEGAHRDFYCNF